MKKMPERICAVCRQNKPKDQLIRLVKDPAGKISLDLSLKKQGRGAYICKDPACCKTARQKHSLERSLKGKISEDIWQDIENIFGDKL